MTGAELKERLSTTHISLSEIARRIGISPQSLNSMFNSEDVKSGVLEKLSKALDVPIAFFYGDAYTITGNNIVNSGDNNAVNANDDRLVTLLLNKDEQLTKSQSQIDRLLGIIENCQHSK